MLHRFAHLKKIEVAKGDKVKRGDIIGSVGMTGNATSEHLHYDCLRDDNPDIMFQYTKGLTNREVYDRYADPALYLAVGIPCDTDYFGWKYLEWTGTLFHSGLDLNSRDDDGKLVYSPVDGEIVAAGDYGKWGNLIVIKQKTMEKMEKIKIQDNAKFQELKYIGHIFRSYLDVGLKFKVAEFFIKNGIEIEFGDFLTYFASISKKENPAHLPDGTCGQTIPYAILFAGDPNDIEKSTQVLIHEILHALYFANLLGDIHAYKWGVSDNQTVVDYLLKNLISDKKQTMVYILNGKGDQFILIPELKIAYTIANPTDLGKLKVRGLTGEPIRQEVLADYLIFVAVEQRELRDLFNI